MLYVYRHIVNGLFSTKAAGQLDEMYHLKCRQCKDASTINDCVSQEICDTRTHVRASVGRIVFV